MGRQGFKPSDAVCRSAGVLVGVLGDRVVACDFVGHQAHVVGGVLGWLVLLDEATPLAELVAEVVASTGSSEQVAREQVTGALRLGRALHLLGGESRSPGLAPARRERTVHLRAGAVRAPSGDIWLLPGGDDRGVATLIGELVQAGCDDLGRELVGVRGDSIVVESPSPLQGEYGPIVGILVCEHPPDNEASAVPLDPYDTAQELVSSALNLSRTGDPGVQTICDLAANAAGLRIHHHDHAALARVLIATEERDSLEDLDWQLRQHHRQHHGHPQAITTYLDHVGVRSAGDVASHDATIEGNDVTFVTDRAGYRYWALTGLHRRIWHVAAADDPVNLSELVHAEADNRGGSDERSALVVARALMFLMDRGLIYQVAGDMEPGAADLTGGGDQSEEVREMWRRGPSDTETSPVSVSWPSLASSGYAIDWLGHRLVTDVDSVRRVLVGIRGAAAAVGSARLAQGAALVEIRSVPGRASEMLIRLNGTRLWYLREDEGLGVLGIILANLTADHDRFAQPLGEISVTTWHDRCVVKVGGVQSPDTSDSEDEVVRHHTVFGARVQDRRMLIPEPTRAANWLADGATAQVADLWTPHVLAGVVALGAQDVLSGWLQALTELTPDEGTSERLLAETVAHGDVPLSVVNQGDTLPRAAERVLTGTGDPRGTWTPRRAVTHIDQTETEAGAADTDLHAAAWRWASRLGRTSWAGDSAKITRGRLCSGRGLVRIRLPEQTDGCREELGTTGTHLVRDAIAELGVNPLISEEIARVSVAAGNLLLGVEAAGPHIRRKLYVQDPPAAEWQNIASKWPERLRHGQDTPRWLAWKWTDDGSGGIERAVYLAHLGGAEIIGDQADPLRKAMGAEWVAVVDHLLAQIGVERQQVPRDDDLLALDDKGRRSVDISRRPGGRRLRGFVAESQWLAAAADLNGADSRDLVVWSRGRRLSRLIFGIDGRGEQFVNLYGSRSTDR
jgi:hypothetical protein